MIFSAFKKRRQPTPPNDTLLAIGVHREELAFGEAVAQHLDGDEIDCLRIAQGLSARRPRPDQLSNYLANHTRLYAQIAETASDGYGLLIDLHCRRRETADADIFTGDPLLLAQFLAEQERWPALRDTKLRGIRMVTDDDLPAFGQAADSTDLFAKPELPESVWRADQPVYVGLEIYLDQEGKGHAGEWKRATDLITLVRRVVLSPSP